MWYLKPFYYENGNESAIENYNKGRKDGAFKSFYNNDEKQLRSEEYYDKDRREGQFKYYYEDGTLKREEYYDKDRKDGIFKTYYENSIVEREVVWDKGEKIKTSNYDMSGNLLAPEKKEEPAGEE